MSDELDRLFECLVEALSQDARLAVPFPAADLYERLVPYRSNRSRLKVATHQDYEMAVLRLLAGERGLVQLDPPDVREGMQREVTATNPDTAFFRNFPEECRVGVRGGDFPLHPLAHVRRVELDQPPFPGKEAQHRHLVILMRRDLQP